MKRNTMYFFVFFGSLMATSACAGIYIHAHSTETIVAQIIDVDTKQSIAGVKPIARTDT